MCFGNVCFCLSEYTYASLPLSSPCRPVSSVPHSSCTSSPSAWPAPPSSSFPSPRHPARPPCCSGRTGSPTAGYLWKKFNWSVYFVCDETVTQLLSWFILGFLHPLQNSLTYFAKCFTSDPNQIYVFFFMFSLETKLLKTYFQPLNDGLYSEQDLTS